MLWFCRGMGQKKETAASGCHGKKNHRQRILFAKKLRSDKLVHVRQGSATPIVTRVEPDTADQHNGSRVCSNICAPWCSGSQTAIPSPASLLPSCDYQTTGSPGRRRLLTF